MANICLDQQHKLHLPHSLFSPKKTIDIPPRKLINEAHMQNFFPYNNDEIDDDNDDIDPFSSDHFRMYEFKVRRCMRSRSHDWTDCPFAHPGEKARRRDPRKYHYSGTMCPDYRRGGCTRGDNCEFAHGVFECWLHPSRYRTEACKDGKHCKRKVCFFAHSARELRTVPMRSERKYGHECCRTCQYSVSTNSPNSTLLGISHFSPPLSPSQSISPPLSPLEDHSATGFSRISGHNNHISNCDSSHLSKVDYVKDMMAELIIDIEAMNFSEASPISANNKRNVPWINVPLTEDDTHQIILSPSTPSPHGSMNFYKGNSSARSGGPSPQGSMNFFNANSATRSVGPSPQGSVNFFHANSAIGTVGCGYSFNGNCGKKNSIGEKKHDVDNPSCPEPEFDVGWVQELVM